MRALQLEWLAPEWALISLVLVPLLREPLLCAVSTELILAGRTLMRGSEDHQADLTGKHIELQLAERGRVLDVIRGKKELLAIPQG